MPGYSGVQLARKLGIKAGMRVHLAKAPSTIRAELRSDLAGTVEQRGTRGEVDLAMLFARSRLELAERFGPTARRLAPAGTLWACWPKRSSGVTTDLDDEVVRAVGIASGWVDVKVCSVSAIWSGLKFVRRRTE